MPVGREGESLWTSRWEITLRAVEYTTRMDKDLEKTLWEELKILQSIIDKFDDFSFRINNWFLTIYVAITGYAVVNKEPTLILLNFIVIVLFYYYEITYRTKHGEFLDRSREVQELIREGEDVGKENKSPYLDRYFSRNLKDIPILTRAYRIQKRFGIDQTEARKNICEFKTIFKESARLLFKLRISFPYVAACIINISVLILVFVSKIPIN